MFFVSAENSQIIVVVHLFVINLTGYRGYRIENEFSNSDAKMRHSKNDCVALQCVSKNVLGPIICNLNVHSLLGYSLIFCFSETNCCTKNGCPDSI